MKPAKTYKKGQKVETLYGNIETVMTANSSRVFTYESLGGWYHPTKVFPVTGVAK